MIISHSAKFIFIHIQRTGGSTIINLLKKQLADKIEIISQHGNIKSEEAQLIDQNKDYFTFAFVRNPWDRILSWYTLINKNDKKGMEEKRRSYEEFLELDLASAPEDIDFHYNQLDYCSNADGEIIIDHIFHFENYQTEVKSLFERLNLPPTDIPKVNSTWNKNYRNYYTSKSQALIAKKCSKDIEYFNYKF